MAKIHCAAHRTVKPCASVWAAIRVIRTVTVVSQNVPSVRIVVETRLASIANASIHVRTFAVTEHDVIPSITVQFVRVPTVWSVIRLPPASRHHRKTQLSTFVNRHRAVRTVCVVSSTIVPSAPIPNALSTMTVPRIELVSISDAVIRVIMLVAVTPYVVPSIISQFARAHPAMWVHRLFNVPFNVTNQLFRCHHGPNVRVTMIAETIWLALTNNAEIHAPNRTYAVQMPNVMHNFIAPFVCAVKDTQVQPGINAIVLDVVRMQSVQPDRLASMRNVWIHADELNAAKMHSVVSKVIIAASVIASMAIAEIRWCAVIDPNVLPMRIVHTIWNVNENVVRIRAIVALTHSVACLIIVAFVSVRPDLPETPIKFVPEVSLAARVNNDAGY